MLPDRVSNPGPLTYESGALPTALRDPAHNPWWSQMLMDGWTENRIPILCLPDNKSNFVEFSIQKQKEEANSTFLYKL